MTHQSVCKLTTKSKVDSCCFSSTICALLRFSKKKSALLIIKLDVQKQTIPFNAVCKYEFLRCIHLYGAHFVNMKNWKSTKYGYTHWYGFFSRLYYVQFLFFSFLTLFCCCMKWCKQIWVEECIWIEISLNRYMWRWTNFNNCLVYCQYFSRSLLFHLCAMLVVLLPHFLLCWRCKRVNTKQRNMIDVFVVLQRHRHRPWLPFDEHFNQVHIAISLFTCPRPTTYGMTLPSRLSMNTIYMKQQLFIHWNDTKVIHNIEES